MLSSAARISSHDSRAPTALRDHDENCLTSPSSQSIPENVSFPLQLCLVCWVVPLRLAWWLHILSSVSTSTLSCQVLKTHKDRTPVQGPFETSWACALVPAVTVQSLSPSTNTPQKRSASVIAPWASATACHPPPSSGQTPINLPRDTTPAPTRPSKRASLAPETTSGHSRVHPQCLGHSSAHPKRPRPPRVHHNHRQPPAGHVDTSSAPLSRFPLPHHPPRSPPLRQLPGLGVLLSLHGHFPWFLTLHDQRSRLGYPFSGDIASSRACLSLRFSLLLAR